MTDKLNELPSLYTVTGDIKDINTLLISRGAVRLDAQAVDGAIDEARFERAPCYLCGYNGPGYYQPDTHPCAAKYHAAQHQEHPQQERKPLARADYENHSEYLGCTSAVMRHDFESGVRFAERHHGIGVKSDSDRR